MAKRRSLLFPESSRFFPGQRWVNISLRTLHLIGLSGSGYGFLANGNDFNSRAFLLLTVYSGVAMMLISIWSNGIWLLQLRGQTILLKLLLLGLIPLQPDFHAELFITVIILSGLISHAPGNTRYYSVFYGRRIDSLP
ncbi:MAG TPA: hypothetical protein EYP34_08845 [Chromatiaceae bacterium]|nr:hypothetical protein [Chromatiaceae bacterium]